MEYYPKMSDELEKLEEQLGIQLPSPLEPFTPNWPGADKRQILVKRDDLIHPLISGNKWRKLKHALATLPKSVITFGGGYSNHLHALGFVCHRLNIPMRAIVRGHYPNLTPTLQDLNQWGTDIEFVDKIEYKKRAQPDYLESLSERSPEAAVIPEGGSQDQALLGVAEILQELPETPDYILAPVASGGTLAGLISAGSDASILGIGVLKGEEYLNSLVEQLLPKATREQQCHWKILADYHHGGYAKAPADLKAFCDEFNQAHGFDIEPVYSGKLFWALKDLLAKEFFPEGTTIVMLHTGGLQGARDSQ